ncbi:MAG: methyl-accepting chemotaxis protein [Mobilitalea sp.]
MKEKFRYAFNRRKRQQSEKIFEGISAGRKKALDNWFKDKWIQLEVIKKTLATTQTENDLLQDALLEASKQSHMFIEVFLVDDKGTVTASSYRGHIGNTILNFPNLTKGLQNENYMYGPYCDPKTLDIQLSEKPFFDEVTLLFSTPFDINEQFNLLCARVLNDDMSNIIQEEDTHIYKDSGDNYLFMIKNNRKIPQGMAISRSRFEDNTFTLGDNLKEGIATKHWGSVKVDHHTELEIMFTDPATGKLHQGVGNTIKNKENLDCWPGYPDYRHIMVGGKGTIIEPPYSDEVWGMMCEGDISDIYHYTNLNRKIPLYIGLLVISAAVLQELCKSFLPDMLVVTNGIIGLYLVGATYFITKCSITKPLNNIVDIVHDIADGEGSLKKRITITSTNEIGQLIRWINKFISNQMNMIKRVKDSLKISKRTIKTVSTSNDKIQRSIHKIEDTVKIMSQNSMEQNSLFGATQQEVRRIADSFEKNIELDQLMAKMREKADKTSILTQNSKQMEEETVLANSELEKAMAGAVGSIFSLEQGSKEITNIVSTISGISKQTSLLALNASIEAARAGEVGKGFAVVAGEIKKLSEGTNEATKTISQLITSIQQEINQTNNSIIKIEEKVKTSIAYSTESIKSTELMIDISKTITYILNIMSEQSHLIQDVRRNIIEMSGQNEENTSVSEKNSTEALELVTYIIKQTEKLSKVIESLEYSTGGLEEIVEEFKID